MGFPLLLQNSMMRFPLRVFLIGVYDMVPLKCSIEIHSRVTLKSFGDRVFKV